MLDLAFARKLRRRRGLLLLNGAAPVDPLATFGRGEDDGAFILFNTLTPRAVTKQAGVTTQVALSTLLTIATGDQKLLRTRAATYAWIAAGGVPIEVASDGKSYLVVEPAKTNQVSGRGSEFDNAAWTKANCTITANSVVAPDGTQTADHVTYTSSAASIRQTGVTVAVGKNSQGLWLKSASAMTLTLRLTPIGAGSPADVTCNLTTDWQDFSNALTASGSVTSLQFWFLNFTQDFDVWGAQIEAGSFTSTIYSSGGVTKTRAADQISVALASIPSLGSEYTIYADFIVKDTPTAAGTVLALSDGTANEVVALQYSSAAALSALVTDGGVSQAAPAAGVNATAGVRRQLTLAVKANDIALSADGGAVVADTSATLPSPTTLTLGATFGTTGPTTEVIKFNRLAIVPRRVSDADLPNWRYSTDSGPFEVWLVGGQSNGTGRGSPINTSIDIGGPNVWQWTRGGSLARVIPGNEPLDHIDQNGLIGPAVAFMREHYVPANPGKQILLVPCAKGGSSFYKNDWNVGDTVYEDCIARMNAAMASTPGNVFGGVIWQHGETDTETSGSRAAYQGKLDNLFALFRSQIRGGGNNTAILVGGMVPEWVAADANRAVIQAILADTPNRVVNSAYADPSMPTALPGTVGDIIHYPAASQRLMGAERYGAAAASLGL